MANNLKNYELLATPPKEAVDPIKGGSKGAAHLSSIKAQWRIKALTEVYGEYGIGWYFEEEESIFPVPDAGVTEVFTECRLYVRDPETKEWRPPAVGKGQCHFVSTTKNGLFVDDEARKKAMTDAFGNAAKYFGVGGTVYMGESIEEDNKYAQPSQRQMEQVQPAMQTAKPVGKKLKPNDIISEEQISHLEKLCDANRKSIPKMLAYLNGLPGREENPADDLNQLTYKEYCELVGMFKE